MTKEELKKQLLSIIENSESFINENSDPIWEKDIEAIKICLDVVEKHYKDKENTCKNKFAAFIRCCNGENVESEFSLSSFDEAYNLILKWLKNEEYTDSWYDAQYPMYSAYILEYTVDSEGNLNESVEETQISLNGEIYND